MAASQIQISDSKFDMESAVHTSQGETRMVFFAQLQSAFSRLVYYGVLPYLAFGPFAVQLQDSIFRRCNGFRPQLQTLVTPGIPDDHSEGEVSLLLGLRSWWSELTYTMSFGLNISMAAAFSCHVCNVMFLALNPQCGQDKELHTI